jgi:hypothetical protein
MPVDLDSAQVEDLVAELVGDLQILSGMAFYRTKLISKSLVMSCPTNPLVH